ncbi:MAG: hypothetical protein HC886_23575 [Leptolyngbyaceae cyanobacterium SM1_1_3]|nr:hypothetical protein [Leptolyngbyaceae cyanobacterium SM1_1_3]NJM85726.1 hypothetical protein [Leptolyngbyaceae cyanobacterium RM2_2_21]NJN04931.1 hypothetical protein [Leptolyngbyaceae cyanobacterium RM1_1_2]NJO11745.1 hypothetical protein [Leptolyngbyaceae cyanobacterium SL_1_1]
MTYLILLAIGFAMLLASIRIREEVLVIATTVTGLVFLVWGFALTPASLQLIVEVPLVIVAFPVCIRCLVVSKVSDLLSKADLMQK